jgi:thiol-disulfide isomerase/thioredoxin
MCSHVAAIAAVGASLQGRTMNVKQLFSRLHLPFESRMASFDGANGWLNSEPLAPAGLDGKVVVVQFWTYTCINWLRTLPYMRAWADAYDDHGLIVVGVHTPEFGVEHDIENVRRAVHDMGIEYPVAIDNDYAVWNAFGNQYWPALYIADPEKHIRHHHFGEGDYERSEGVIRQLLADAGAGELPKDPARVAVRGIEIPADWDNVRSPETYVGLGRSDGFSSGGAVLDAPYVYTTPSRLHVNEWAFAGDWTVGLEKAVSNAANGRIAYCFHARDLNLILTPPAEGSARFRVLLDGRAPGDAHGLDVDEEGEGVVNEQRLYQLIRQDGDISDRQFEIELLDPGAAALCFTFG